MNQRISVFILSKKNVTICMFDNPSLDNKKILKIMISGNGSSVFNVILSFISNKSLFPFIKILNSKRPTLTTIDSTLGSFAQTRRFMFFLLTFSRIFCSRNVLEEQIQLEL